MAAVNGQSYGAANGAGSPAPAGKGKEEFIEGVIYPPPDIRSIVDKTAAFTAKNANPQSFEDKIRQRQASDSRFSFINEDDPYHDYYVRRVNFYKAGGTDAKGEPGSANGDGSLASADAATAASKAIAGAAAQMVDEGRPTVPQPRPYEFITAERPPMAAVDHDILKLTALFTARMGRGFTGELSQRESGNYQFDFLRPSHSLFGYFNRLVEQYTKVLMAPQETLQQLEKQSGHTQDFDPLTMTDEKRKAIGRREIMKGVHNRVEWQKYDNARRQAEDTAAEEERIAFATIDWQDFIVVSTIEFTDQDAVLDLPPPMSRSEVENMTLAQKRMAAMIMEGKDVATAAVESGAISKEAEEAEMDMSGDEADQFTEQVKRTSNAPQEAKAAVGAQGAIKIRKDYVPKSQRAKKVAMSVCRICGQEIPEAEMAEHVRIELLDPRWKEKQMISDSKRSASNMLNVGTDVASSLKAIAHKRTDIFSTTQEDQERQRRLEEEERLRKREREKVVWDGHTSSALSVAERFQSGANLDEQIAALHRAKGLTQQESSIGPRPADSQAEAATAAPQPAFLAAPGSFAGATLSAAPNPNAQAQQNQWAQYQPGQARPAEQSTDANKRQKQ